MDYNALLRDRDFSSPMAVCEWMENAEKAIIELLGKVEQLEKQIDETNLNPPIELSGQGVENFALAIQLSEMQQKLEEVTTERDALLKLLSGECDLCAHFDDCTRNHYSYFGCSEWEWLGIKEDRP